MKKRYLILIFLFTLITIFLLGPKEKYPAIDPLISSLSIPLTDLDAYINEKESKVKKIKADNEARIIWADSIRKTPYSIVYLHGFSASQKEGDPLHKELAKKYGCNLYLARLAQHGIDDREVFKDVTPKDWVDSAKEAIAIGKLLGKKTIVMSCSTGSTLSAFLAAHNPDFIDAQLMYSPNIEIAYPSSKLLTKPWGKQLAYRLIGTHRQLGMPPHCYPFWTKEYRVEGLIALQSLLDETMKDEYFTKIKQPTFVSFYYKNEAEKDGAVSIDAIHSFFDKIQTPIAQKRKIAFPNVGAHVFISDLQSKDLESPRRETFKFMDEVVLKKYK